MIVASNLCFLEEIRLLELNLIENFLEKTVRPDARILEIGAGTGWQARALASKGYEVCAIDIATSNHAQARIWPIIDFDGSNIPFPDASFDVVYSSNVLEHVLDVEVLSREIARVLRRGGAAIHYVPTSAWRAWSLAAFYPALFREGLRRIRNKLGSGRADPTASHAPCDGTPPGGKSRRLTRFLRRVVPHAHGSVGTCMSELYRFSQRSWDAFFSAAGWTISFYARNELFLSGEMICGARLPTHLRRRLSKILGSTAHLYVLKQQMEIK